MFLRYAIWTTICLLVVCLLRLCFLKGAHTAIHEFFGPPSSLFHCIVGTPLFAMNCLGGGWGVIVPLASFNKFKTDIVSFSWIICIAQILIFLGFSIVLSLTEAHFISLTDNAYFQHGNGMWTLFLSGASALSEIPFANFWSLLYFGMLTLAAIIIMSTQLLSILTSLFDEFTALRLHKFEVTFGAIGILAILSLYFCTNLGVLHLSTLSADVLFTQGALSLLLFLVLLWIYGRERFQRDFEFMVSKSFASWRIFMLRFISPFFLIFVLVCAIAHAFVEHYFSDWYFIVTSITHTLVPWLILPGYVIYLIMQSRW